MSNTAGQCGLVSGAVMGISLLTGRNEPNAPFEGCFAITKHFVEAFKAQHETLTCPGLLGMDISQPGGLEAFFAQGLMDRCSGLAESATRLALESLERG